MASHKILSGLLLALLLVACIAGVGCTEKSTASLANNEQQSQAQKIGTYIGPVSNCVYRCTLFDDGTCEVNYIRDDGFTDAITVDYEIGTFKGVFVDSKYSLDEFANKSVHFPPEIIGSTILSVTQRDFADAQYYKINLMEPLYISQRNDRYWLFYPTASGDYTYATTKMVVGGSPCEIYILGTPDEPFEGDITVSGTNMKSESIEGQIPEVYQYGYYEDMSLFVQKSRDNQRKMTAMIYDTFDKRLRNYGSTSAGYGVISLTT